MRDDRGIDAPQAGAAEPLEVGLDIDRVGVATNEDRCVHRAGVGGVALGICWQGAVPVEPRGERLAGAIGRRELITEVVGDARPIETTNLDTIYGSRTIPWSRPRDLLAVGALGPAVTFVLGTVRPDGRPHAAGIGAAW